MNTKPRCAHSSSALTRFKRPSRAILQTPLKLNTGNCKFADIWLYVWASCAWRSARLGHDPSLIQPSNTLIRDNNAPPSSPTLTPRQRLLEIKCQISSDWLLKLNRYRNSKAIPKRKVAGALKLSNADISFVMFVRPSVRMYQPYQHVLSRFSWNMTLGTCTKMSICPNLVKIGQKIGQFTWRLECFIMLATTS